MSSREFKQWKIFLLRSDLVFPEDEKNDLEVMIEFLKTVISRSISRLQISDVNAYEVQG